MAVNRITLASALLAVVATAAAAEPTRSGATPAALRVESSSLAVAAPALRQGDRVHVADVEVPATSESLTFDVARFEVFAPDVEIVVHGKNGSRRLPRPQNVYLRGEVVGEPGSRVFLESQPNGRLRGVIARPDDHIYLIDNGDPEDAATPPRAGRLQAERADNALLKSKDPWECEQGALPPVHDEAAARDLIAAIVKESAGEPPPASAKALEHTARVAIETDYEFYAKFNNTTTATNYVGNLLGYASTIYLNEIDTNLVVQSLTLWTGGAGSDPWTQTTTTCGLMEFGRYWNLNRTGVSRTIAHFLSGKSLGGGIAWLGVLCSGAFNAGASCPGVPADAPWGGGYGFTASISGTFNVNNPTVMWDIMAVAHEIGHNFSSPHTHCYNGIGGSSSPIDQCRTGESGCYAGTQSLPGPAGAGSGTIMSYCHLLGGGFSNVSLNFGTGHPYGVLPARQATRMKAHVDQRAAGNPSCLAPVAPPPTAPTVTAVTPKSGLTTATTAITVVGSGFLSGAAVTLSDGAGSIAAGSEVVVNANTITATVPPHATGAMRVTVTNPNNQSGFRDNAFFYAPPPPSTSFYTVTPCRILDTRNPNGPLGGPALGANAVRTVTVANVCGIPSNATAIAANVTVVAGGAAGYFAVFPGNAFPMGTSTISFNAGRVRAANSILTLATNGAGTIGVQNASTAAHHVIIDVTGYFR
jgi:hypothetical protein